MAELFKNIYSKAFVDGFATETHGVDRLFDAKAFSRDIFDDQWEAMELKQRMRHLSHTLDAHLHGGYADKVGTLITVIDNLKRKCQKEVTIEYMFIPDYVEVYGLDDYDTSVRAMEQITEFTSCEFAVRPFIIRYQDQMLAQLQKWSKHDHHMVRRLASEGSRPRLPWAMALPAFKKDPTPLIAILERLKDDETEIVRRSVANHINDVSKDNPELAMSLAKKWYGSSKEVDWVVKHACRTLLKKGHVGAMKLFGYGDPDDVEINDFVIETPEVKIGEELRFSFTLKNTSDADALIRLEYAIYYQKKNGSLSKKVFKISERKYAAREVNNVERSQPFKIITTRVLYPGLHRVSVIVNGKEGEKENFYLALL